MFSQGFRYAISGNETLHDLRRRCTAVEFIPNVPRSTVQKEQAFDVAPGNREFFSNGELPQFEGIGRTHFSIQKKWLPGVRRKGATPEAIDGTKGSLVSSAFGGATTRGRFSVERQQCEGSGIGREFPHTDQCLTAVLEIVNRVVPSVGFLLFRVHKLSSRTVKPFASRLSIEVRRLRRYKCPAARAKQSKHGMVITGSGVELPPWPVVVPGTKENTKL
jgi:hypothetical protein